MARARRAMEAGLAVLLGSIAAIPPAVGAAVTAQSSGTIASQTFAAANPGEALRRPGTVGSLPSSPDPSPGPAIGSSPVGGINAPLVPASTGSPGVTPPSGTTPASGTSSPPGQGPSTAAGGDARQDEPAPTLAFGEDTGGSATGSSDTSRGAGGNGACSSPDRPSSCPPVVKAPSAAGSEYVVTATIAQVGTVSAGTYVFGTNADGSPRVLQATPVAPGTVGAAGLDRLVGQGTADRPLVGATLAKVASPDGSSTAAVALSGDKLLSFAVDKATVGSIADPDGKPIVADSEKIAERPVVMLAAVAERVVQSAINLGGVHQANGYLIRDGKLVLVYVESGRRMAELAQPSPAPTN
jgi:hypothetical protein